MQRFKSWSLILFLILFSILTALAAGTRVTPGRYAPVKDRGAAASLDEPALLEQPLALIARSANTPLAYHPLTGDPTPTGILPYPDVNPRRWQAGPASPDTYHIVWQEQDNRLRCALINTSGVTVRGPIELATSARPDFVTLPGADGDLLVIWINNRTAELSAVTIDSAGRPGPISNFPSARITHIAAARDRAGLVHVAWLTSPTPDQWTISYRASSPNPLVLDAPADLHSFTLAPGESITTLQLGLDDTHVYLIWSTTTAAQPDRERIQVISFPLGSPADGTLSDVRLPGPLHPDTVTPTYAARRPDRSGDDIPLPSRRAALAASCRWAEQRPAAGRGPSHHGWLAARRRLLPARPSAWFPDHRSPSRRRWPAGPARIRRYLRGLDRA